MKRTLAYLAMVVWVGLMLMSTAESQKLMGDKDIGRTSAREAWLVYAFDNDIDTAFELVADDAGYANLTNMAGDKIELQYDGSSDSARVHVIGVMLDSTRKDYVVRVSGTTQSTTSDSLMAFEKAFIDSTKSGGTDVLTIRDASSDTKITTLVAGQHHSYIAQRFGAKKESNYITQWSALVTSATGTIEAELRIYADYSDMIDIGDDYTVVDAALLPATIGATYQQEFHPAVLIPTGSVAMIVAKGGANNSTVKVKMSGYLTR